MAIIYQAKKYLFASMDANTVRDKFKNVKKGARGNRGKGT
jgi:hypothetical protein